MLSLASPIKPLQINIVEQLQKIDDFYICTKFTEDMIGPSVADINGEVHFRFMNFIYLPQPVESLTSKQVEQVCNVRLEHFDELVNYQYNSLVVNIITNCVTSKCAALPLKALDFGCGSGLSSRLLKSRLPDLDLIGVDISEKAISHFQSEITNINAKQTSPDEPLPFESKTFDVIFAIFVMHFKVDIQTLAELHRVLQPSGLFIFNVYQRDIDGLIAQLEEVGFWSIELWERIPTIDSNHVVLSCKA